MSVSFSYGGLQAAPGTTSPAKTHISWQGLAMISVYCFISGLAGVYTELVVKRKYEVSFCISLSMSILRSCTSYFSVYIFN